MKLAKPATTLLILAVIAITTDPQTASALPPFKKAFAAKYTDKEKDKEYSDLVRKANCNLCHIKGERDKSKQNEYGKLLNLEITGIAKQRIDDAKQDGQGKEEMEKLLKELDEAFGKVAKKEKEKGLTWGDVIRNGDLPVPVPADDDKDENVASETSKQNDDTPKNEGDA